MPNYNALIFTGADWSIFLALSNGVTYEMLTVESIDLDIATEEELIYGVGNEDPIGNKQNARKYSGKISLQAGEILSIRNIAGLPDATRLTNCTLAVSAIRGGLQYVFRNVNINSEAISIKRKDKETLVNLTLTALTNV